jgi:pimeloyl-ACP methyl ester carboxylesterase
MVKENEPKGRIPAKHQQRFVQALLNQDKPNPGIEPQPKPNPSRGEVIFLRGISWWNDRTFATLERESYQRNLWAHRYSYAGPTEETYSPWAATHEMNYLVSFLDQMVRQHDSTQPLYVCAHSYGCIIAANWICHRNPPGDHRKVVERVNHFFFFAPPFFIVDADWPVKDPDGNIKTLAIKHWYPYYELQRLVSRITMFWGKKDRLISYEDASLSALGMEPASLDEVPIDDKHMLCENPMAVAEVWRRIALP